MPSTYASIDGQWILIKETLLQIQALDCLVHYLVSVLIMLSQLQQEFSDKKNLDKYRL